MGARKKAAVIDELVPGLIVTSRAKHIFPNDALIRLEKAEVQNSALTHELLIDLFDVIRLLERRAVSIELRKIGGVKPA